MQVSTLPSISIKEVKALARSTDTKGKPHDFAQFFTGAKSLDDAGADAFTKGADKVNYAARLAGATLEWVWSGNDAGVKHLRVNSDASLKSARAKISRVALAFVEGIKPSSERFTTVQDVDNRLNDLWAEFLAILIPDSGKPKTKPINWRQECLNARAERDAALSEVAELHKALVTLEAKLAHRAAIQQAATATATATATA